MTPQNSNQWILRKQNFKKSVKFSPSQNMQLYDSSFSASDTPVSCTVGLEMSNCKQLFKARDLSRSTGLMSISGFLICTENRIIDYTRCRMPLLGGCDMKRFTWWRMEQNAPHNARERWCASCSILHHVKRFLSHSPDVLSC